MSSDSEDDCYGNIAQKLQSLKSKYQEDRIASTNLLEESSNTDFTSKKVEVIKLGENSAKRDSEDYKVDSDVEEISLDAIIAENSKRKQTRSLKRNADISADNILPTRRRRQLRSSTNVVESPVSSVSSINQNATVDTLNSPTTENVPRGRGRGRQRRHRGGNTTNTSSNNINASSSDATLNNSVSNLDSFGTNLPSNHALIMANIARGRSETHRARQTSSAQRRGRQMWHIFNSMLSTPSNCPTYNIGDVVEYPDECYNQPLFTNQAAKADNVIVLGDNEPENDSIDENEELSVKVYWQNCEYKKFTIRRFQKLTQIFNFYAERENVSHDKLLFTYNDKILKIDDTPDSITYNIVKFIDGGIINQSVSKIVQKDRSTVKNGIKLKFQCQNVKKPFETAVQLDDKMAIAMMMCAEHWEKPLDKLKFHFDGDMITGKSTPRDLDLEGGECIDVTIS